MSELEPTGISIQPISQEGRRAIGLAKRLATKLRIEYAAQIVEQYRGDLSTSAIARNLPPELAGRSPRVTHTAVKLAIQALIPKEERLRQAVRHKEAVDQERRGSGFFSKIASSGGIARNAVLTPERKQEIAAQATVAKGQVPWTEDERKWALKNVDSFRNVHGKIDTGLFSQALNLRFHEGKGVRTKNVTSMVKYFRMRNR